MKKEQIDTEEKKIRQRAWIIMMILLFMASFLFFDGVITKDVKDILFGGVGVALLIWTLWMLFYTRE